LSLPVPCLFPYLSCSCCTGLSRLLLLLWRPIICVYNDEMVESMNETFPVLLYSCWVAFTPSFRDKGFTYDQNRVHKCRSRARGSIDQWLCKLLQQKTSPRYRNHVRSWRKYHQTKSRARLNKSSSRGGPEGLLKKKKQLQSARSSAATYKAEKNVNVKRFDYTGSEAR